MADTKPSAREANMREVSLREAGGEKDAKARDQALQAAVDHIEKEFGAGALMRLDGDSAVNVEAISTGALPLDIALGVGGVPRGRIVEIFGPESSGKTTLVYHIIAEAQARGGVCAFVDTEHALDPTYARRIGINTEELLISQPDYGEQALEIVDVLVRSGAVDVVAVDSVAALTPQGRARGPDGRADGRPAGPPDVSGAAQAGRQPQPRQHPLRVHQPDPGEDRRHVREPRDAAGRPGAEVLFLAAARHPPHRDPEGGDRGGRQPGAGQGGQEQGRAALPPGRVRHRRTARGSRRRAGCWIWLWSTI